MSISFPFPFAGSSPFSPSLLLQPPSSPFPHLHKSSPTMMDFREKDPHLPFPAQDGTMDLHPSPVSSSTLAHAPTMRMFERKISISHFRDVVNHSHLFLFVVADYRVWDAMLSSLSSVQHCSFFSAVGVLSPMNAVVGFKIHPIIEAASAKSQKQFACHTFDARSMNPLSLTLIYMCGSDTPTAVPSRSR